MAFDFYSLAPKNQSGLLYVEEDIIPFLTLYLTRHSLRLTYDVDGIYREQVNEMLLEPPILRWSTTDTHVSMQMTYVYRTFSYYQSYPLDRNLLSTTEVEHTKEITTIDPETNKPVLKEIKERRTELSRPVTYDGLGCDRIWFKSDYFTYNDMQVTLAGSYAFPKGTFNRRLDAFNKLLSDINAVQDLTLIIGGETTQLPSPKEVDDNWTAFWMAIANYRQMLTDPPLEPTGLD